MESKRENKLITEKCHQLQASLSDVTRVKIELFSYLSDATRLVSVCLYVSSLF